jgi:hypothetical protein
MKKNRIVIATICIFLAVLMIGSLFVAAGIAFSRMEDFQFGGLVGELLAGKDEISSDNATADTETDSPEELATDESYTEDFTYEDVTDITDPPIPGGTPTLRFFLSGCEAWGINSSQKFFETGKASEWNHHAIIEDYNAKYVRVWGWAAIFKETPLQLGYRIDDESPVYGENAGFYEADPATTTAALGMGAVSALSILIEIPVEKLSGTHTVQILVRNQGGYNEGVICTFEIEKVDDLYTRPVFEADAAYLNLMLQTQQFANVSSYSYTAPNPLWGEGGYVKVSTTRDHGYFTILPADDLIESTGARYLAIKYRDFSLDSITLYLGSGDGPGERGGVYQLPCTDVDWQFVIIDLEELESVNNAYDLSYIRFDFFAPNNGKEYSFEIAYVATFDSIEAAQAYNAEHPYAKG